MAKNNAEKLLFNVLNFFPIFFRNFLPQVEYERNSGLNFFFLFLDLSDPVLAKSHAGKRFFNFFLIFFSEFSLSGRVWTEFGTKIFFLFLGLSHPVLARNNAGKSFFFFLIFWIFLLLFRNFLAWVEYEWNSGLNFSLSFSSYLIPFWLKIMPERGFLIFVIFLQFFWNFFARVEYERNLGREREKKNS